MSKVLEITGEKAVAGHTREARGILSSWACSGKMTVKPESKNSVKNSDIIMPNKQNSLVHRLGNADGRSRPRCSIRTDGD